MSARLLRAATIAGCVAGLLCGAAADARAVGPKGKEAFARWVGWAGLSKVYPVSRVPKGGQELLGGAAAKAGVAGEVRWIHVFHRFRKGPSEGDARVIFGAVAEADAGQKVATVLLGRVLASGRVRVDDQLAMPRAFGHDFRVPGKGPDVDGDGVRDAVLRWTAEHTTWAQGGVLIARSNPDKLWQMEVERRSGEVGDVDSRLVAETLCFVALAGADARALVIQKHKQSEGGAMMEAVDSIEIRVPREDGSFAPAPVKATVLAQREKRKAAVKRWAKAFRPKGGAGALAKQSKGGKCPAAGVIIPTTALGDPPTTGKRRYAIVGPFGADKEALLKALDALGDDAPEPLGMVTFGQ